MKEISIEKESLTITELQLLILKLFGSQAHLLNLDACNEFEVSMNIEERFLKYSVPFQDIKPDIYLGKPFHVPLMQISPINFNIQTILMFS